MYISTMNALVSHWNYTKFKLIFSFYSLLKSCAKIGEGVYGEVFKAQYENGESIALKVLFEELMHFSNLHHFILFTYLNFCHALRPGATQCQLANKAVTRSLRVVLNPKEWKNL